MSGEYIIVDEGKVVGHCCGRTQDGRDCREVPDGFPYEHGADIRNYTKDWVLRPLAERIKDGLVIVSEAEKIEGEMVVAKNRLERIRDGIDREPGMKVVEGERGLEISPMSILERLEAGEITRETADIMQALEVRVERGALLAGCDWTQTDDQDPKVKALWKPYRQALKDIPSQGGFPWNVEWPETPDGIKS